jgi:hypothetical protein
MKELKDALFYEAWTCEFKICKYYTQDKDTFVKGDKTRPVSALSSNELTYEALRKIITDSGLTEEYLEYRHSMWKAEFDETDPDFDPEEAEREKRLLSSPNGWAAIGYDALGIAPWKQ